MRIKLREKVNLLLCGFKQEWRQTEYKCAIYNIMGTPSVDLQLLNAERKIRAVSKHFIANTRIMIYARQTRNNSSVRNVFLFFSSSLCSNRLATFKPLKINVTPLFPLDFTKCVLDFRTFFWTFSRHCIWFCNKFHPHCWISRKLMCTL
jgi:hypothetical protein